MIRIVLLGRTGNNLFQYALGRALAEKHDVPLVLDASWFNASGWQEVSYLLKLPLRAQVLRDPTPFSRALRKLTGRHRWQFGRAPFLAENPRDHSFDRRFSDAPGDCSLFGYFQSWRYFAAIEHALRDELRDLLGGAESTPLDDCLKDPASVAVHVRRSDFLTQPAFQVCGKAYYRKAIGEMRSRLAAPKFLIFSDDPCWCRSELAGEAIEVVDSGKAAANPLHDLRLMSLASHHIIANSSYSWWAAWIGAKPGQQVILPDRWFASGIAAPIKEKRIEGWMTMHAPPSA